MATVKKSNKRFIIPICIVLVIAIIAGSIFFTVQKKKNIEVSLATITSGDIFESVSATGQVSSGTRREYKVSTVATVKEVFVSVGDQVKKGDQLVSFDLAQLDSQVASLQESYNSSAKSYEDAVKAQKEAQEKAKQLKKQINKVEKQIKEIEDRPVTTTTKKKATTAPQTKKSSKSAPKSGTVTAKASKLAAGEETSSTPATDDTTSTTKFPVSIDTDKLTSDRLTTNEKPTTQSAMSDIADSIGELTDAITSISDNLETITTVTDIVGKAIAEALASGQIDSDAIADLVGQQVSQAISDGIIDSTTLLVENDVAVKMIEAAVRNIDFEAFANSDNVAMTTSQLQLTALNAQYELYNTMANGSLVDAQKSAMKANKASLEMMKKQRDALQDGWKADFDGTITDMSVIPGADTSMISTGLVLENLDSLVATISLGEYDVHKVKVGMDCVVKTAYGTYDGVVSAIAPTATGGASNSLLDNVGSMAGISGLSSLTDSGAGVLCTIEIMNPDENIIAGFDANVEIHTGEYLGVVQVPLESLKLEKTGSYVYLYDEEEGTVTKTLIQTGANSDSSYQVLEGLKEGDRIVATPSADYEEDTFKVKVVEK